MGIQKELGFYIMTSIKEIKLIGLAFIKTPLEDLAKYFQSKAKFFEVNCNENFSYILYTLKFSEPVRCIEYPG